MSSNNVSLLFCPFVSVLKKTKLNQQTSISKDCQYNPGRTPANNVFYQCLIFVLSFLLSIEENKTQPTNKYQQGLSIQSPKNLANNVFYQCLIFVLSFLFSIEEKKTQLNQQSNISNDCLYNSRRTVANIFFY